MCNSNNHSLFIQISYLTGHLIFYCQFYLSTFREIKGFSVSLEIWRRKERASWVKSGGMQEPDVKDLLPVTASDYVLKLFIFLLLFTLFFFPFIFISWRLITIQYYSGFWHTLTWICPEINVEPLESFSHKDMEPHTAWLNMSSGIMRGVLVSA